MTARYYLGLAATLHDPSLAIVDPRGRVVFAEATERYLQDKRAFNCPPDHIVRCAELIEEYCPRDAELHVAVNWSRAFHQRLRAAATCDLPVVRHVLGPLKDWMLQRRGHLVAPWGDYRALAQAMLSSLDQAAVNLRWRGFIPADRRVRYFDHHLTHAAAACYTAPFDEAACAVVDGFGEWTSTAFYQYRAGRLRRVQPAGARARWRGASLGMFYASLCYLCGFDPVMGEEWKVMGLAPYGQVDDELRALLGPLLRVEGLDLLTGCSPAEYRARLEALRRRMRAPGSSPLEAANLACTGQSIFEDAMRTLLSNLHDRSDTDNLVLAGGCALNSTWNGKLLEETPFTALHVPSAPADDGTSIGAAWLAYVEDAGQPPQALEVRSPYLGSRPSRDALQRLQQFGGLAAVCVSSEELTSRMAQLLADGRIVAWMQGRAEFGPRALGHRSILADPRPADMQDRINAAVKFREDYRPLAPSILHERGAEYFENYQASPYMERTLRFRESVRSRVPAVVHVNGSGRVHSVTADDGDLFYRLLHDFDRITGIPILLNTSLNVMGKPIVHSVEDAIEVFCTTGLDVLVIDNCIFEKKTRADAKASVGR